jgi:hypothetical protein
MLSMVCPINAARLKVGTMTETARLMRDRRYSTLRPLLVYQGTAGALQGKALPWGDGTRGDSAP